MCSSDLPMIVNIILAVGIVIALIAGYMIRKMTSEAKLGSAEAEAKRIVEDAVREGETQKKEMLFNAKEEAIQIKETHEAENRERRSELQKMENRLMKKEENLDRKNASLDKSREKLDRRGKELDQKQKKLAGMMDEKMAELERVAGMSRDEARDVLMEEVSREARADAAVLAKRIEDEAKADANKRANEIVAQSIQRYAADHVAESTVSVVNLPSDEMKGRIIGREGRNIRALEKMTG